MRGSPGAVVMSAIATAVTFVWLGMVLAISFLEAPLKFRAPGVTLPIGVGIGRLVFGALNRVEIALAAVLLVTVILGDRSAGVGSSTALVLVLLVVQLAVVRPRLNRRSDRVLAGETAPRSRDHVVYIGLEVAKVIALVLTGAFLLAL